VLEYDIREDDAKPIIAAIGQLRGVIAVVTTRSKAMETLSTPAERVLAAHIERQATCGTCAAWNKEPHHAEGAGVCTQIANPKFAVLMLPSSTCDHWSAK
jgi:hypothetical protein